MWLRTDKHNPTVITYIPIIFKGFKPMKQTNNQTQIRPTIDPDKKMKTNSTEAMQKGTLKKQEVK